MKFQPDRLEGTNTIVRSDTDRVQVGAESFSQSVLVPWKGAVKPWPPAALADLQSIHFEQVLELQPELVIFGSGARLQFIHPGLYQNLIARRIGVETMDTAAACRTYNVLAAEGRCVVAALLITPPKG